MLDSEERLISEELSFLFSSSALHLVFKLEGDVRQGGEGTEERRVEGGVRAPSLSKVLNPPLTPIMMNYHLSQVKDGFRGLISLKLQCLQHPEDQSYDIKDEPSMQRGS